MKLTKQRLKQIIKEELCAILIENDENPYAAQWAAADLEANDPHRLTGPELRAFLRYLGVDPDNLPESDPLTPKEVADILAAAEEASAARSGGRVGPPPSRFPKENTS